MFDFLLLASVLLFAVAVVASALYYKHIRGLRDKYGDARDVISDIVVSFNAQLRRYEEKLEAVSQKTGVLFSRNDRVEGILKEQNERIEKIAKEVSDFSAMDQKVPQSPEIDGRIKDLLASQKQIRQKIIEVEKKIGEKAPVTAKGKAAKIEAPIPIKREKALAPLTETELRVLKILAESGPKTAPEVRDAIDLTREHTARLMKKLYEEGYLERSVQKIPYTYRIKREMLKILEKQA